MFIKILFNYQGECVIRANKPDTPDIAPFRQAYHKIITVQEVNKGLLYSSIITAFKLKSKKLSERTYA